MFKAIPGAPYHKVNEYGEVISTKPRLVRGAILYTKFLPKSIYEGYYYVYYGGRPHKVSRLVAEVFLGNPDNLPVVDHLDEDRLNDHATNLEYVTHKENVVRSSGKPVEQLDPETDEVISVFRSKKAAADHLGILNTSIGEAIKKNRKSGGFKWRYSL